MNIIVRPYGTDLTVCRPDTTWERENKDIFLPEETGGISYAPILFARVSKAGKCVGKKFASRYYDAINYGVLLYDMSLLDSKAGIAAASCTDHTSILPSPLYNICTLESGDNFFRFFKDGNEVYSTSKGTTAMLEEAIVEASRRVSLRIGDMVCIELDGMNPLRLPEEKDSQTEIHATFCDNETFRLKIS